MNLATNLKSLFLTGIAIVLLLIAGNLHTNTQRPIYNISKQDSAINLNDNMVLLFSSGQRRLLTSVLWITTLLESDIEHYKNRDLNSWMFLRFNLISKLDPLFLNNYQFGGRYLSIVKDDLLGAEIIFDKGLKYYPDNYYLNFDAGFLQAFELQNFEKAKKIYSHIKDHPQAPEYLKSLIGKLSFGIQNDLQLTFKIMSKMYEEAHEDSPVKAKLKADLYSIKAEIDITCLTKKADTTKCDTKDLIGEPYIYENGKYRTKFFYRPFRLNIKQKK